MSRAALACALAFVAGAFACTSSDAGSDAGPDSDVPTATFDANVSCTATSECASGEVCAYAVDGGCGAAGQCIYGDCVEDPDCPSVPTTPACGCNGSDVGYVTAAYTSAPASSPTPCVGVDASSPDAAGATDASGADAGGATGPDATDAALPDAADAGAG